MRFLLDTHVLLWISGDPDRLPRQTRNLLEDRANTLVFSVVSIWEIAIKRGLGRPEFQLEPLGFRNALIENGLEELLITSAHAAGVASLPDLHRDPFDRLLVAQAIAEGLNLLSGDRKIAAYPGPIRTL